MNRRDFLQGLLGLMLLPSGVWGSSAAAPRYLSARGDAKGGYFLSGFDLQGRLHFDLPLPARGHGIALHPQQPILVQVARRPGTFLLVIDARDGRLLHSLQSRSERHFQGHAVFSADGRWLYSSENHYTKGRGVIGIRDSQQGYRQVGELASHGLDPHDLRLLPGSNTLVVANGGILTHPDQGRDKLNLDSMSPSLVYLDAASGQLLEEQRLPQGLHQNSIRHLALGAEQQVCLVMQFEGARHQHPPLVGLHRRGQPIQLLTAPESIQARLKNYCGSACADPSGQLFAASSPKGGLVTYWQASDGRYLGATELVDGCGLAPGSEAGEFLLSSGHGELRRFQIGEANSKPLPPLPAISPCWDNHMSLMTL